MPIPRALTMADTHTNVLSGCVVPLLGLRGRRDFRIFGSGTLVQVGSGDTFLFTAGHVADAFEEEAHGMWIWKGDSPIKIHGDGFSTGPKRFGRTKDLLDLASIKLTRETTREFSRSGIQVIDATAITRNHPRSGIYAVIGYPLAPNMPTTERLEDGSTVSLIHTQHAVVYATRGDDHDYGILRRRRRENVVLRLAERKDIRAYRSRMPKTLSGMSGGAIFYLGTLQQLATGNSPLELAGIFTDAVLKQALLIGASTNAMATFFTR